MFSHRLVRFLAGANVGKVNVAGFSTKKEMEVFIWCTLDWSPMHSFAARYFCYHHNNILPAHDWSTVYVLSSLIGEPSQSSQFYFYSLSSISPFLSFLQYFFKSF